MQWTGVVGDDPAPQHPLGLRDGVAWDGARWPHEEGHGPPVIKQLSVTLEPGWLYIVPLETSISGCNQDGCNKDQEVTHLAGKLCAGHHVPHLVAQPLRLLARCRVVVQHFVNNPVSEKT